jgi:integrase
LDARTPGRTDAIRQEAESRFRKDGNGAEPQKAGTLIEVVWARYHDEVAGIQRKACDTLRLIERHIAPHPLAAKPFLEMTTADYDTLFRDAQKKATAIIADRVKGRCAMTCEWYRQHVDVRYQSPIGKAKRDKREADEKERKRVLADWEIAALWNAWESSDTTFGQVMRLLTLLPLRRDKVATMRWSDINFITRTWTIPKEAREKGTARKLVLPEAAMKILRNREKTEHNQVFVFGCQAGKPFRGFGQGKTRCTDDLAKAGIDFERDPRNAEIEAKERDWRPHDCRRTGRTLLTRLKIDYLVAESLLGHSVGTRVSRIYNRAIDTDEFRAEMNEALEKLSAEIMRIVAADYSDVKVA